MIRRAKLADLEQIEKLSAASVSAAHWPIEVYASMLRGEGPARMLLVAENSLRSLVGVLVVLCQAEEWELENIVVAADERQKGIGRELISKLVAEANAGGAEKILLEVRVSNSPAIRLYQSCGFEIWSTRKSYYSNPLEDAIVMIKKIGKSALEIS
ncbi:MAG TPA: ribosomal protein S18-alanine N-acetyltransferase [candidate division Zixibacteria bacterium]|nr:ribosomal protein S18-alanine N-acetyltransferase [candidate division Zixibacteria bacterium]